MTQWRKSSRSNGSGGNNCVEVRENGNVVTVRNSKHPDGVHINFTDSEWRAFLAGVKAGEFDPTERKADDETPAP